MPIIIQKLLDLPLNQPLALLLLDTHPHLDHPLLKIYLNVQVGHLIGQVQRELNLGEVGLEGVQDGFGFVPEKVVVVLLPLALVQLVLALLLVVYQRHLLIVLLLTNPTFKFEFV